MLYMVYHLTGTLGKLIDIQQTQPDPSKYGNKTISIVTIPGASHTVYRNGVIDFDATLGGIHQGQTTPPNNQGQNP